MSDTPRTDEADFKGSIAPRGAIFGVDGKQSATNMGYLQYKPQQTMNIEVEKTFATLKWAIALFVAGVSLSLITPTMLLRKTFELLYNAAYKLDEVMNEIVAPLIDVVHKWSKK